jgi:branched-chain amino acid transport system substrate-binding protein
MKRVLSLLATACLLIGLSAVPLFAAGGQEEGAAKEPVKVGAILAVTGGASWLGSPEAKTLEMLLEETKAAGGIDGHPVELIVKDSQGSAEKAISFAKQLIEEEQVLAIIGPSTSGESMAIKDICQEG